MLKKKCVGGCKNEATKSCSGQTTSKFGNEKYGHFTFTEGCDRPVCDLCEHKSYWHHGDGCDAHPYSRNRKNIQCRKDGRCYNPRRSPYDHSNNKTGPWAESGTSNKVVNRKLKKHYIVTWSWITYDGREANSYYRCGSDYSLSKCLQMIKKCNYGGSTVKIEELS